VREGRGKRGKTTIAGIRRGRDGEHPQLSKLAEIMNKQDESIGRS